MEFLEGNPKVQKEAQKLLSKFEQRIDDLKKTDVESFRRKIEEAPNVESKSRIMRNLMEQNVPASLSLLDSLLQKSKNDTLQNLEWMYHRVQTALSLETFSRARTIAEDAYSTAKCLFEITDQNPSDAKLSRKLIYKAYIKACVDLLLVCRYQGKLKDAELYLEEAKAVANSENDKDNQHLLLVLTGDLLLAKGQLNKAIDTVFTPLQRKSNVSLQNKGLLLQKLGNACRSAARWGQAKEYLRESIEIADDLGDLIAYYDRSTDLGNVYRSEGRIADALENQGPHMAFAFKRGDLWGITVACFNMGFSFYSLTPNPDLKRALCLLSLKHDLAARTENEPLRGMALNNLGKTFCALEQYEEALKVMKQSLEIARKTQNIAGEGMAYGNIGTAYRSLSQYEEAVENHNKYLMNAMGRGDDGGAAIMQRELAIDYVCKGDFENAEKQARDAISTLETIRNKLDGEDASKIANFDKNQSETYSLLQVILCRQGKYAEALALSELARSRALTDLIRDKLIQTAGLKEESWIYTSDFVSSWQNISTHILADFLDAADKLDTNFLVYSVLKDYDANGSAQQWLYIWVVLNKSSANGKHRIHFKSVALSETIQEELLVDKGFFASLTRSFRKLTLEEKQSMDLPPKNKTVQSEPADEVVRVKMPEGPEVDEFLRLLGSLSFTEEAKVSSKVSGVETSETTRDAKLHSEEHTEDVSADKQTSGTGLRENEPTDERANMVRLIECASWKEEGIKQLLELYKVCIKPIADVLPYTGDGAVPSITIIPHEFLFSVPFCCLHDGKNEYLVERFVLSYAPSLRALLLLNQRLKHLKCKQGDRKIKLLTMGDAFFGIDIDPLPSSGDEATTIREVFGNELCRVALRNDASKGLLLEEMKNIDILHVATHAGPEDLEVEVDNKPKEKIEGDYAMRGSLVLASSGEACNGVVKASEIASKDCACQLVTLSCCETGLGKVTGDGVVGLYRAFFAAGAASVLVTLWKIRDDVTPMFMEHFYNKFKETGNLPGSLRSAMVYCIREKKLPPQQWAAFSYVGAIS